MLQPCLRITQYFKRSLTWHVEASVSTLHSEYKIPSKTVTSETCSSGDGPACWSIKSADIISRKFKRYKFPHLKTSQLTLHPFLDHTAVDFGWWARCSCRFSTFAYLEVIGCSYRGDAMLFLQTDGNKQTFNIRINLLLFFPSSYSNTFSPVCSELHVG